MGKQYYADSFVCNSPVYYGYNNYGFTFHLYLPYNWPQPTKVEFYYWNGSTYVLDTTATSPVGGEQWHYSATTYGYAEGQTVRLRAWGRWSGSSDEAWDTTITLPRVSTMYTVSYDGNGNTGGTAPGSQQCVSGGTISLSGGNNLTKTGYNLDGWATSASGAKAYDLGASYTVNSNVTMYAHWSPIVTAVTLNQNGGSGGTTSVNIAYNTAVGSYPSITKPTRTGYSFNGYWTATSGGTQYYNSAGNSVRVWDITSTSTTLYAQWTPNTYTVTYAAGDSTGGTLPSAQTKTYGVNLTLASNTRTRGTSTATGTAGTVTFNMNGGSASTSTASSTCTLTYQYTANGWSTSSGSTGTPTYASGGTYSNNSAVTLYPCWTRSTQSTAYANVTSPSSAGTKTGYTFKGWATSSSATTATYAAGASVPGGSSVTYYAVWQINTYAVTYNAGDSSGGTLPANQTKVYGTALTLGTNSMAKNNTTASGTAGTITFNPNGGSGNTETRTSACTITYKYTANGWSTSSGSTGTPTYASGASYTGNAALTLYPCWSRSTVSTTYANVASPTDAGSKSGCEFLGWATSSTATSPTYLPGDSIPGASSATYYAVWRTLSGKIYVNIVPEGSINYAEPTGVSINKAISETFVLKQDSTGWYFTI